MSPECPRVWQPSLGQGQSTQLLLFAIISGHLLVFVLAGSLRPSVVSLSSRQGGQQGPKFGPFPILGFSPPSSLWPLAFPEAWSPGSAELFPEGKKHQSEAPLPLLGFQGN